MLAAWKRDCAWLRSIINRATVLGVVAPAAFNPDTITTESITLEHLRQLHELFVSAEDKRVEDEQLVAEQSVARSRTGSVRVLHGVHASAVAADEEGGAAVPQQLALALSAPHTRSALLQRHGSDSDTTLPLASAAPSPGISRRASLRVVREPPPPPAAGRLAQLLYDARRLLRRAAAATKLHARTVKRSISTIMYSNERELLLGGLLEWAKHDKQSGVAPPSVHLLRWRTQHEWHALGSAGARLGERDATERSAYLKFSFLFSDYSVHGAALVLPHAAFCERRLLAVCASPPFLTPRCLTLSLPPRSLVLGGRGSDAEALSYKFDFLRRAADGGARCDRAGPPGCFLALTRLGPGCSPPCSNSRLFIFVRAPYAHDSGSCARACAAAGCGAPHARATRR